MHLSKESFHKARRFILGNARPLEQARLAFHFEQGPAQDVLEALASFQNADGGFGHGLEPDIRLPASSVIATTLGLQVLREVGAPQDHPLVERALGYLAATFDPQLQAWPIIPSSVEEAPHAPWWGYDEDLAQRWGGFLANPRAEIVGHLWDYPEQVAAPLREQLTRSVVAHLEASAGELGMHDLLCYVRLVDSRGLPQGVRDTLIDTLQPVVSGMVERDPAAWAAYGLKPLDVVGSPESPFAAQLADAIEQNLDFDIERQQPDGSWAPAWSWEDLHPDAWAQALREWQGVLTLTTLRQLQAFGRLGFDLP